MEVERKANSTRQAEGKDRLESWEFLSRGKYRYLRLTKSNQAVVYCIMYS